VKKHFDHSNSPHRNSVWEVDIFLLDYSRLYLGCREHLVNLSLKLSCLKKKQKLQTQWDGNSQKNPFSNFLNEIN
jgi:hypothetical protein